MPFKSESQRRYMWLYHPKIAEKWSHEGGRKKNLPYHKKKKK